MMWHDAVADGAILEKAVARMPKEMQERHKRVLAGMLKLPENRECAACRARSCCLRFCRDGADHLCANVLEPLNE